MSITIQPPSLILYVLIGIGIVSISSVFLKKGNPRSKLIGLVALIVILSGAAIALYRPKTLSIGESGLTTTINGAVEIPWNAVVTSGIIQDLDASEYDTRSRMTGTAIGPYRSGTFKLANGERAKVLIVQTDEVILLKTKDLTYLFGPRGIDDFKVAVEAHLGRLEVIR